MTGPAAVLPAYLEQSAARFPKRPAVVDPADGAVSYARLNGMADRFAGYLGSRGIGAGDRVGLLLPKGTVKVAALYGAMKAGAAYVPLDWTAPAARLRAILTDCPMRTVVVHPNCLAALDDLAPAARPQTVVVTGERSGAGAVAWEEAAAHPPLAAGERTTRAEDLAYILYTSGSTGVPKGVMLTHENATSFVEWAGGVFRPTEQDRFSSHAPFYFDLSVLDLYLASRHGACVYLIGDDLGKNPRELARFIAANRLTVWYSAPSILGLMAEFGELAKLDCSALRLALFAGEVFPVKRLRALTKLWPHPRYYNLYGPTETNVCTFAPIPLPVPEGRTDPYPIGAVCDHCEALVLGEEGRPVEPGREGLLHIAGPAVFRGYWNRADESRDRFVERYGKRWYNTGDVVVERGREGFVYLGRRDRMVKRRGYRIELGEIESVLHRHLLVREAAVVARSEPGADVQIIAYVATRPEARPSMIEMKLFTAKHLPTYMSPDRFEFVAELPRTSTAKVDYQTLRRGAGAG
ncbi:MAG: amino acid adenylation domain-containing protein [Bryobacteraceae bacterium]|nr:amino acid adenylation domain-containing protein [Bryobacteraceae bacterium]